MNYFISALKNYVGFDGRARRSEFWYFMLFNVVVAVILGIIGGILRTSILSNIWSLALLLPGVAVAIRRMHDVGKSGWYCLIPIYSIILAATEGDKGDNEYGADPKATA